MSPTRKTLNFEEKNKILIMLEDGIHSSVICKEYGISKRTLFRIKKSSESLKQNFNKTCKNKKRFRKSRYEDINNYVEKVVKDCNEAYIPINFEMLKCIAEKYAKENKITQFKGSNGWVCSLKKNKLLSTVCVVGESRSADINSSNDFLNNTMPSVIKEYDKNNIFNLDETGLFYKLLPNRTVKLKGKRITGLKQSKERITVCFLVNENGEKFPLLILGKSANPRCFKNFNLSTLNIIYKHNKNAWVTLKILSEYLSYINEELAKIKRNILIIMDNCPAHKNLENFSNIRILFLPPNTTSLIQPLDHGIIRAFKANYKKGFISNIFSQNNFKDFTKNLKRYSILDAIFNIVSAFNKLEVSTFQNCFKCLYRTNILIDYEENNTLKEVTEYSETFEQFQENLDHSYGWSEYLDYDNFKNVHKEVVNELAKEVKVAHLQNISKVNLFYEEKQKLFNYLEEIKNLTMKFAPESILTLIEFENKVKDELNKK